MSKITITDILNEAGRGVSDFTKKVSLPKGSDNLVLFKMVQTLSNFHDSVGELYASAGNTQKAKYHFDLSQKLRSEASGLRSNK